MILGLLLLATLWLSPVLFPPDGQALGGLDSRGQFYVWLEFVRESVLNGRVPFWNAALFGGYPFLSDPQIAFFYPVTWLTLLLPTGMAISWHIVIHLTIAGSGMYFFVRKLDGHPIGALLAALTFAFSGYASARIYAGHIGFLATNSWLPLMLLATVWASERKTIWAAILAGFPFGMAILAGNPTSLLYSCVIWGAFVLYWQWQDESKTAVLRQFLIAGLIGLLLSGVQLLPFLQFSTLSTRAGEPSFEFASAFSLPPAHLLTLLVPEFFGEPTRAGYWSVPNFEELTYYAGVLPLLGLILAFKRPSRHVWFYLSLIAFGILLALGSYGFLFRWIFTAVPPFRVVRAPARATFLYTFAIAALLGEAVTIWLRHPRRQAAISGWMRWILGGTAVIGLTTMSATGAVFAAVHPTDTSGRLWHQLGGWGLATGLLLVGGLLLWQLFKQREIKRWLVVGLAIVILADLWVFGSKFARLSPMTPPQLWTDVAQLMGDTNGRVLPWGISIFDQNGAEQVGVSSVFGYNPLEIGANNAFAASVPDPRSSAFDILGASHVVSQVDLGQFGDGERPLTLVAQQNGTFIYERSRVLPIVRLVDTVEIIPDEAVATARVHAPDFDAETAVIFPEAPACPLNATNSVPGTASVIAAGNGYWDIQTESSTPALLIVSETAYPGWRVWINGNKAEWQTAYTAVRAVCVPAGTHTVEWRFQPAVFWQGGLLSLLVLGLMSIALTRERRKERNN